MLIVKEFSAVFLTAIAFVIAFAWRDVFKTYFDLYVGRHIKDSDDLYETGRPMLYYALVMTLVGTLMTYYLRS